MVWFGLVWFGGCVNVGKAFKLFNKIFFVPKFCSHVLWSKKKLNKSYNYPCTRMVAWLNGLARWTCNAIVACSNPTVGYFLLLIL